MSRKIVLLMASIIVIIGTLSVERALAQPRIPGVSVGDWAEYAAIYTGNAALIPPDSERMEWMKVTVQEISGTNITFQQITRYADMHEDTSTYVVDVDTGQGNATGVFIAANLYEGDLIYTDPPPSAPPFGISFQGATINETISQEYLGEVVEINHLNMTTLQTFPGWNETQTINLYWYRATGIPAEVSVYVLVQPAVGYTMWMNIEFLIISVIPEFPSVIILPLLITISLIAVILSKKLPKK